MDDRPLEEIVEDSKRKNLPREERRRIEREAYKELRKRIRKLRRIH